MGSFNWYKKKVYNSELSIWTRLAALRSCLQILRWHREERFSVVLKEYDDKYHFNRYRHTNTTPPSGELLIEVVEEMDRERKMIVAKKLNKKNT